MSNPKTIEEEAIERGEKLICYSAIEHKVKQMAGEILTIVDASIVDEKQNKALKDLVKGRIRETLFDFQGLCLNGSGHSIQFDN